MEPPAHEGVPELRGVTDDDHDHDDRARTTQPRGGPRTPGDRVRKDARPAALLGPADWSAPTECPQWDVRRMYLHVLGASHAGASMRENAHQMRAALAHRRRHGGPLEAALSSVQVREREELDPAAIVEGLAKIAPRTLRGRRRVPALVRRHARTTVDGPVHEKWTLGYLIDTIYLRDMWMHRIDACRATGRGIELTAAHDGRIVADVVAEWARRHDRPFTLELHGPAGGSFAQDPSAPETEHLELDAVGFCRTLAGREPGEGLLATVVPF
ncbi:MAG: maleylpyruvate isomerase family mycothiol-dependent enzyme [Microthrixaceae bacterium]